jgi:hypothetical protein
MVCENVASLPTEGVTKNDFYYAKAENILCIYDNTINPTKPWIQINPDTNTDTDTNTFIKDSETKVEATANGIDITLTLNQIEKNEISGDETPKPVSISFNISKENLATVSGISVGLEVKSISNGATVKTVGTGADSGKEISFVGGTNVTVTATEADDKITISAEDTKYSLAANNDSLIFTNLNSSGDVTSIALDDDNIVVAKADKDKITISHKDYTPSETNSESTSSSFTAITGIETEKGHVTGITTSTVTIPDDDTTITDVAVEANNTGDVIVTLTDSNGDDIQGKATASLYYTVNGVPVYNQGSIEFYTKDEIDT